MPKLVINPFVQITFFEDEDFCVLVSPKFGFGLQNLKISKNINSLLYDLFLDLSKVRLDFLDIENDLSDKDREILYEYGVLVEDDNIPQKPLFACQLSEVELVENKYQQDSLIVNPSIRFEPLNLGNFNAFAQGNNLLPYQPSVWIKTLFSEIEIGYWLNDEESSIISQFLAGNKVSFQIDEELLNKLVKTEILISPKKIKQKELEYLQYLQQIQLEFKENKYTLLKNLLPSTQMKAMRNYYRDYIQNGFMPFSDNQVKRRYYQHNEPLAKYLHGNLTKTMNLVVGQEVKPSYVYAASYEEDAVLIPHTDRPQCEFSFSFQVDYHPEPENQLSPWGLFVAHPEGNLNEENLDFPAPNGYEDKNTAVYLASGDALAYKGCELIHYRYALPKGHKSTSLFFHFVPIDFDGKLS